MRTIPLTGLAAVLLLASCGGAVRVGSQAVDETARAMGVASRPVALSSDEVSRLALQADVPPGDIETIAPQLHRQQQFDGVLPGLRRVGQATEGEVRAVTLSVACDGLNGRVSSRTELYESLAAALIGLAEPDLQSLASATEQLWQQLYEASQSTDPSTRATVALTCFTAQTLG